SMIIIAVFVILGCSNNEPETTTQTTETAEATAEQTEASTESMDQDILSAFEALGESENIDLIQMSAYLGDNIDKVSSETADLMLQLYEEVQMQLLPTYQDAFFVDSIQGVLLTYSIEEIRQNQVKEEPVQALLSEATAVGYKMEAIEGTVAPYVDYGYLAKFAEFATQSTGAFYKLMKVESDNPSQKDAALIIPWAEVLERGLGFESYIKDNPGSFYDDRARMHLEGYEFLAINGSANVPLFDFDSKEMDAEAKAAYTAFVNQGLQTPFATLIKTYVDLLETHDFIKTTEIEAFMSEYN
ncbi:MAG TPA: hypothetical protein VLS94_12680, partial [Fusibacter sp.]|nr:hypothetical protein [Fusibacter sp.]